ncbi:type IV pilus biogenesis/stability protein PilW [Pendulispora albinea]|uniref:Tetratricopeptide repeat protein n=1 Tax=Pendulispora albinea TaxID=2741071 RepID=A0ABZ2M9N0_9BACT
MRLAPIGASLLLLTLGALGTTPAARAQSGHDSVTAQALFDEGQALMKSRRYAEACVKFESSHRIDPRPGTVLNLANCYEENGQTASAWARYVEASELAARENQREREKYARERVRALAPKLPRLTVKARGIPADAVIERDGVAIDVAVLGTAVPVDPGEHAVVVVVRDKPVWSKRIHLAQGAQGEIVVAPSNEWAPPPDPAAPWRGYGPLPAPGAKPVEAAAQAQTAAPAPRTAAGSGGWSTQKTLAVVSAGVGVVGIGLGTYFGLTAGSRWSDAKDKCQPDGCPRDSIDMGSDAKTDANMATVAFIVGGVALAGAGVLWFSAPARPSGAALHLVPAGDVRTGSAGLVARGRFELGGY